MGADRRRVWFVCRDYRQPSEVWLERQLTGFTRLQPTLVCWKMIDPEGGETVASQVMVPGPLNPEQGPQRWVRRLRNLGTGNYFGTFGSERRALKRAAAETRPEAVLAHFGTTALRVLPVALEAKAPVVAHFHGSDVSSTLRNRWYRSSLVRSLKRFAAIVVVGSHQRQWMLDHGAAPERVHLIPCGAPAWSPAERNGSPGAAKFIAVSRLVPWKGVDVTIRAFSRVRRSREDAVLTIVGDGPERASLEGVVKELGLEKSVRFTGAVPQETVRQHLAESDVFVQHSLDWKNGWTEGFGVSITEAAFCGLPIVASRCGGIVDQVVDGETGLLVPQGDVEALGRGMLEMASDRDRARRMGASARERAQREFAVEGQIRKLEDVVMNVIEEASDARY